MIYALKAAAWVIHAVQRVLPNKEDWLDLHNIEIALPGLPPAFDGYRIAQFSDLHFDRRATTPVRLRELVTAINAQQPDLIAFTGDFVTEGIPFRSEDLIPALRELHAHDAKVAIFGNHDHHVNMHMLRQVVDESGLIDLNNNVYVIQRGESSLRIAGVDSLVVQKARLDLVLPRLPQTGGAILLAHEPSFADISASSGRFALQLSGHMHGGQIRLPLLTTLMLREANRLSGLSSVGDMLLYVNRGIGMVGLPLRIRCPSELTIITLRVAG
ncbi:MAG: metallophosphoesterase [Chloroflexi bacterium]|nr:metallophosphoesterase [Chloroflexota bacterium]